MRRPIRVMLLATTFIATPMLAQADPITLTAIAATAVAAAGPAIGAAVGSAVAGAIIAAALSTAITVAGQLLFAPNVDTASQSATRSREFDPHPPFRFAFGAFPLEGSVVFHYAPDGGSGRYYVVYLLNSVPSDSITKIEINDGQDLPFENDGVAVDLSDTNSDIYDMQKGARVSDDTGYGTFDGKERIRMWIGLGEHTQAPQDWLDEIGPAGDDILKTTDTWAGATVVFAKFRKGPDLELQKTWGLGVPPPLRFFGKWSKLYDPRKDPTSGVTGASGTHDRTTWEWSENPALCALMLVRHDFALGFDDEMIPIQQYADAADACEVEDGGVSELAFYDEDWSGSAPAAQVVDTDPGSGVWTYNRGSVQLRTGTDDILSGTPVCSLFSTDTGGTLAPSEYGRMGVYLDMQDLGRSAEDAYTLLRDGPIFAGQDSVAKYRYKIYQAEAGGTASTADQEATFMPPDAANITLVYDRGDTTIGDGSSFDSEHTIEGRYISFVVEGGEPNESDIEVGPLTWTTVSQESLQRFATDGLVVIDQRELSLLEPVLACMAGHIDPTDGLLGIRAGVWVAPTDTLSQPIGDEVEIIGARDSGFDTVRAKFIGAHRGWEETDGPGYQLRAGARVHPLQLPLVSRPEHAARLEKIAALRAEPNRIISSVWDGRELNRRIGERVNFALPGFARAESTFVITSKTPITREVDDGFEISAALTLTEDLEATYDWDAGDFTDPGTFTGPVQSSDDLVAPTSVTIEQDDYRSAAGATARLKITVAITQALSEQASTLRIETTDGSGYTYLTDITVSDGTLSYVVYLSPVSVGVTYTGRARAESATLGVSAYTTSDPLTIVTPVLDYATADYNAEYA